MTDPQQKTLLKMLYKREAKLHVAGNSKSITLPKDWLNELGVDTEKPVTMYLNHKERYISLYFNGTASVVQQIAQEEIPEYLSSKMAQKLLSFLRANGRSARLKFAHLIHGDRDRKELEFLLKDLTARGVLINDDEIFSIADTIIPKLPPKKTSPDVNADQELNDLGVDIV